VKRSGRRPTRREQPARGVVEPEPRAQSTARTPASAAAGAGSYERIYAVVRRIPKGRIATYGQVAELAGLAGHARQVGYALSGVGTRDDVPWQRVVNARGEVSPRAEVGWDEIQRSLLEDEGVEVDARGRIDLVRFRWKPRGGPSVSGRRVRSSR
jgi:methylated-DNA-protein-cysteine methyltransferase related protein